MTADVKEPVRSILEGYDPRSPGPTADRLRALWLQFEPKSMEGIKAEQRAQQETVGIPVPVLKAIGKEVAKPARKQVNAYLPLTHLLWTDYGREGRVVAVHALGPMELAEPESVMPILRALCRTCLTWEDADQLAMNALEPIVRKEPERWLGALQPWLADENKWVRRAGITAAGRLPMKLPAYTARCVEMTEQLLPDEELDVRRAVSFAIRLCARGELEPVRDFLARHVPPEDPAATWVLCDAIRSMAKKLLPKFAPLLPLYEAWVADPGLGTKDRRSVESAVRTLQGAES
jgi:3-methyladenine DNA glycosylase AlkD